MKVEPKEKWEQIADRMDIKMQLYRDQILAKIDEVIYEIRLAREEDLKDHEKRIKKLEQS